MRAPSLDLAFAALADPTRRAIVARLSLGEATVGELIQPFDISPPAISRHLRLLEEAHLIRQRREGKFRHCALDPAGLNQIDQWLEFHRRFWSQSFDRLAEHLENPKPKGSRHGKPRRKTR